MHSPSNPLLSKIRANSNSLVLLGFNNNIVLFAHADDVIMVVRGQNDVDVLTDHFKTLSAAKVNWNRSKAVAIGEKKKGLPTLLQNLAWKREGWKYLRVFLSSKAIVEKKNPHPPGQQDYIQRSLTGPTDLVWRDVASCIFIEVSHLRLDTALFFNES